ncbi:MAG: nucleoside recognition domain-containing protein [Pseudomonadota bacterium]
MRTEAPESSTLRFLLPSLLGALIFLVPLPWQGGVTLGIAILTSGVRQLLADGALPLLVAVISVSAAATVLASVVRWRWLTKRPFLQSLFVVSPLWVILRLLGVLFAIAYVGQVGPQVLQGESVGGAVFRDIGVNMLMVYVVACLLLPLLTDYGLMEFIGTLCGPFFNRVLRLPGQAAIDATASVVGASAIGLLITIGQYERGRYTAREACVIATCFSIVSIPFSLLVATVAGIEGLFLPWYATVLATCLLIAVVLPRLPPLAGKSSRYYGEAAPLTTGDEAGSLWQLAWRRARERAAQAPGLWGLLASGVRNLAFFAFVVIGASLALAALAALLVFHTEVFVVLGKPFVWLLQGLGLPAAEQAAPALFSGFLDQFMPALAAGAIESERTSFVLAGLSVCQLVFLSEVGVIMLRSSLPLGLWDLLLIFLLRTAIALPALVLGAYLFVS